jgi:hypothetical protein
MYKARKAADRIRIKTGKYFIFDQTKKYYLVIIKIFTRAHGSINHPAPIRYILGYVTQSVFALGSPPNQNGITKRAAIENGHPLFQ